MTVILGIALIALAINGPLPYERSKPVVIRGDCEIVPVHRSKVLIAHAIVWCLAMLGCALALVVIRRGWP